MSTNAKPYKETLNLPVTKFDMKANLTVREPQIQARWAELDLYRRIREARGESEKRVLHDGPPYANGEIHMGHLLNKVLKDVVVRYLTMRGYDSPYVPGWDCHGLPIEHKVAKDLGSKAASMTPAEIRELCQTEAMKWVGIQRDQFKRLGVSGDWENPYLTLDPRYEAGILDVLVDLVEKGYVFRQLKPIHWDIHDRTALAEAELEYEEVTSTSVYVLFPFASNAPSILGEGRWNAMIWTTTPWTLPANVAIAANPTLDYVGVRYVEPTSGETVQAVLAAELVGTVLGRRGITEITEVARFKGAELENATYDHVFLDRKGRFVLADYVSSEDGTGLVHTAPGHGAEDYITGQKYGLPTISPVDASGRFTSEAPEWLVGKGVFVANPDVVAKLTELGVLFHHAPLRHSYPHGWRSKKPVIFRATHQWFISVEHDDLRKQTLQAINGVRWLPSWGKSRIDAMVGGRPDWCISRQRAWGVPIPALYDEESGYQHLTGTSVRFYRDMFRREGADAWYTKSVEELVPPDLDTTKYPVAGLRKGTDILDVWFESGSSHRAVLDEPTYGLGGSPAFLYLEGSDQHRGWFQSSILTSVGSKGKAPFQTVLTHGFVVDENGKKMAKSGGNAISAVKATEQYGADVLRLYVASMDYAEDVRMSEKGIKEASETYRKIRNTFRYLLGNLEDYQSFNPTDFDTAQLEPLDRWALAQLNGVIRDVTKAYEGFDFYRASHRIYQFCSVDLSSFYLDVLKDRLYAEAPRGVERRSAQFVMATLHEVLVKLLAPIMPHTAEEIYDLIPPSSDKKASVHLCDWPSEVAEWDLPSHSPWSDLISARSAVLKSLEELRSAKLIGSSQEAGVRVWAQNGFNRSDRDEFASLLETICIVSELKVVSTKPEDAKEIPGTEIWVAASKSTHSKCERCWNYRESVGMSEEHPTICKRCCEVLATISAEG